MNLKFKPSVGFVSDFAGYYKHLSASNGFCFLGVSSCGSSAYTFMFGPQFSFPLTKVTPYVHVLLGAAHAVQTGTFSEFTSNNSIAVAFGGGLDYHLTRHFALRGQADFLGTHFTSTDDQDPFRQNVNARISGGLVVKF